MINTISKLYRYNVKKPDYKGQGGGILTGTLYVPSLIRGLSASSSYKRGQSRLGRIFEANSRFKKDFILSTSSSSGFRAADECLDYVFIDPPFGSNLNYSELSFLWESSTLPLSSAIPWRKNISFILSSLSVEFSLISDILNLS